MILGKIVARNVVKRKSGYLYYVDGQGNVCEARMSRGGKRKTTKKKATKRKTTRRRTTRRRRR